MRLIKAIDKQESAKSPIIDKKEHEIYLSVEDRLRWVMEFGKGDLHKVTVSYEIEVGGEWFTIKLYDNTHSPNYLHRHTRESLQNPQEIISTDYVIKKGGPNAWLNWARKDIFKNWYYYRGAFLKRSKLVDKP
jgi:hypothetical protein